MNTNVRFHLSFLNIKITFSTHILGQEIIVANNPQGGRLQQYQGEKHVN